MSNDTYPIKNDINTNNNNNNKSNSTGGFTHVQRLPAIHLDSWEFRRIAQEGSVMPNALISWDVDSDGIEEVILGTTEGQLLVVKPDHRMPIYSRKVAATISVVLYSVAYRRLVLVTLEGQCEVTEGFLTNNNNNNKISTSQSSFSTGVSHLFSIPPNCFCGDITTEEGGTMVFLGSYDRRVYVYSLITTSHSVGGVCLGSLFMQAPVTSMKCFSTPFNSDDNNNNNNNNNNNTYLQVMNISSQSSLQQQQQEKEKENSGIIFIKPITSGISMLLVSSTNHIILLNASRTDVMQWGDPSQSRSVAVKKCFLKETFQKKDNEEKLKNNNDNFHLQQDNESSLLSVDETMGFKTALLQPLWQMPISHIFPHMICLDESYTKSGALDVSIDSHIFSSYDGTQLLLWDESLSTSPLATSSSHVKQKEKGKEKAKNNSNNITPNVLGERGVEEVGEEDEEKDVSFLSNTEKDIRLPAAIDVAVGKYKVQFAVATEDGRWFIFEISSLSENTININNTGIVVNDKIKSNNEAKINSPEVIKTHLSISCISAGRLKNEVFLQRVRVFRVKNDEFCVVFVTTNGTCYAVDTNNKITVQSHVRADALSFTIMAGGSTTHPLKKPIIPIVGNSTQQNNILISTIPTISSTTTTTTTMGVVSNPGIISSSFAASTNTTTTTTTINESPLMLQHQKQQENLLRGPVGRTVSLVCVTVNEIVISSVGGDSYVSAKHNSLCRPAKLSQIQHFSPSLSSPLPPVPITSFHSNGVTSSSPQSVCLSHNNKNNNKNKNKDEIEEEEEEEEEEEAALMLELGTLLLAGEGCAEPENFFSIQERIFTARQLCSVGYSQEEWEILQMLDLTEGGAE